MVPICLIGTFLRFINGIFWLEFPAHALDLD
jgi:hypothetical protein